MRGIALALALVLACAACSDDDDAAAPAPTTTTTEAIVTPCTPEPVATATQERIALTGAARDGEYLRYVPAATDDGPRPLVVDLHGYLETAEVQFQMSALSAVADREGFVLVNPQGTGEVPFWNSTQAAGGPPDVEFLAAVLDDVEHDLCTDPRRVYVTGLSNGAFMSSTLGCVLSDRIAAIAPVAGVRFEDGCDPTRPMAVLAFHGTADTFVSYDGGLGESAADLPPPDAGGAASFENFELASVPEAMGRWAAAGGCDPEPIEDPLSEQVTLVEWPGCDAGADVQLVRVEGGGHAWPGSDLSSAVESIVGFTTMDVDASEMIWDFFEGHPLPG